LFTQPFLGTIQNADTMQRKSYYVVTVQDELGRM